MAFYVASGGRQVCWLVGRLSSLVRGNLWQPRRHGGATAGEFGGAGAFGNLEKVGKPVVFNNSHLGAGMVLYVLWLDFLFLFGFG